MFIEGKSIFSLRQRFPHFRVHSPRIFFLLIKMQKSPLCMLAVVINGV